MDAIALLTADHRTVAEMLSEAASGAGNRKKTLQQIVRQLSIHSAVEEEIVYPRLKTLPGGEQMAAESLDEHQEVKELLVEIERADNQPADGLLRQLVDAVHRHVDEEESEAFPLMRRELTAGELNDMGELLQAARKIAPTRPHPGAPNTPPANFVAGMGTAVVDRARDALRRD